MTSDAPVRRREATQSREVARESDLANAHENEETTGARSVSMRWESREGERGPTGQPGKQKCTALSRGRFFIIKSRSPSRGALRGPGRRQHTCAFTDTRRLGICVRKTEGGESVV